jgi:hypothetical protein
MPDWLYRTSETHTTETDAAGKPYSKDTWEARVLGQVVYKVTTQSDAAPEPETPLKTVPDKKPPTLADKIAHESHWLDIDRTADSRPESPDIPEDHPRKVTNVGVLGFNIWGSNGSGGKVMEKESHWLDVDRIADSRAESPVQSEPATPTSPTMATTTGTPTSPMSPTKKREMVSSPLAGG